MNKLLLISIFILSAGYTVFAYQGTIAAKPLANGTFLTVSEATRMLNLCSPLGAILEAKAITDTELATLRSGNWALASSKGFIHTIDFSAPKYNALTNDQDGTALRFQDANLQNWIYLGKFYKPVPAAQVSISGDTVSGPAFISAPVNLEVAVTINSTSKVTLYGGQKVTLKPGFSAKAGSTVRIFSGNAQ